MTNETRSAAAPDPAADRAEGATFLRGAGEERLAVDAEAPPCTCDHEDGPCTCARAAFLKGRHLRRGAR